ncbi:MAG TPA: FAD-binding oxidoreductase [Dehalococcoidia bacterium]|nr:FAD-binding oxidoreductase [Dehalococcoidia bacterium]
MNVKTSNNLMEMIGKQKVIKERKILNSYSHDNSFTLPMRPRLVVQPRNADDVQKIVTWANQTKTPLVPVSSGEPHFRGDTVPSVPEAVIVDLRRMDKIIRIDRRNRMVLIEPGVTYAQLQPALAEEGLRLSTPLLPRQSKSVIASLLEREPTLVPKYNHTLPEPLRCLEIVWGNGEILRTGDAGGYYPTLEQQWEMGLAQVFSGGPGQVDYYRLVSGAQGSIGIVTWASVKCEVLPKVHRFFFIPADNLKGLIECAYRLLKVRLGDEFLVLNSANLAAILNRNADGIQALKNKLPPWVIIMGIAGRDLFPEEKVDFQEKDTRDIVQQFGLELLPAVSGIGGGQVMSTILNPSPSTYWKLTYKGACQDIFFMSTLDKIPEFVNTVFTAANALRYPVSDIGIYLQPQHQGTACHCEFNLPYNSGNKIEIGNVRELLETCSEALIKQGAYFSRPYGIWADMVYNRDAGNKEMIRTIKGIFDPNNILNPGKLCF